MSRIVPLSVIADITCPWCWIGKRAAEQAASRLKVTLQLTWLPFQLDGSLPADGLNKEKYFERRCGSEEECQHLLAGAGSFVAQRGASVGCEFRHHPASNVSNTLRAHRLMRLAAQPQYPPDTATRLAERLFLEYHSLGSNIGSTDVLLRCAVEAGVDKAEAERLLKSAMMLKAVVEALAESHNATTVVPTFSLTTVPTLTVAGRIAQENAPQSTAHAATVPGGATPNTTATTNVAPLRGAVDVIEFEAFLTRHIAELEAKTPRDCHE